MDRDAILQHLAALKEEARRFRRFADAQTIAIHQRITEQLTEGAQDPAIFPVSQAQRDTLNAIYQQHLRQLSELFDGIAAQEEALRHARE